MSIQIETVKSWLRALDFNEGEAIWTKTVNGSNLTITVDIDNETINYPTDILIGRSTTTNFSSLENFVVLECVISLLEQGYQPKHIHIEKGYRLGHNEKAGNADITISDNKGITFLIIECKTYGREFDKSWQDTLRNGGQLFSYER